MCRDVDLEPVRQCLGRRGHPHGGVDRRVDAETPPAVREPAVHRQQRRAGVDRQLGGTGGHPRRFPEERHRDTLLRQVAFTEEAHDPVVPQSGRQFHERWVLSPAEREDLETETFAVVDEPLVQRFGLQPLGDRGQTAPVLGAPHTRHVPVSAVRQRQNRAPAGFFRGVEVLLPFDQLVEGRAGLHEVHRRQPERLPPVARVGPHRGLHQGVRHLRGGHTQHAGKIAAQLFRSAFRTAKSAPLSNRVTATFSGSARTSRQPTAYPRSLMRSDTPLTARSPVRLPASCPSEAGAARRARPATGGPPVPAGTP